MNKRRIFKFIDYRIIDGVATEIDIFKTDIPERCKLIWAEAMTGNKYELVDKGDSDS